MMLRASGETHPTPCSVGSGVIGEPALEDKELHASLIGNRTQVRLRLPTLEAHRVVEAGLLIERLLGYAWNRAGLPSERMSVDHNVSPFSSGELPELNEQEAAGLGKRRVPKALGIEEVGTGGPVAVLIGEHAVKYENLFSLGMVVRRKPGLWLVAHNSRDLARLRQTHQVNSLSPDGCART